jgi:hypothetical protein
MKASPFFRKIVIALVSIIAISHWESALAEDIAIINPSFEADGVEGCLPQTGWSYVYQKKPQGQMVLSSQQAHEGKYSLYINNESGTIEGTASAYFFEGCYQKITNLNPDHLYVLSFWVKGNLEGSIQGSVKFGVSDDIYGNIGHAYPKIESSEEWQKYEVTFKPTKEGEKIILLMSSVLIPGCYVDDIRITAEE